MQPSRHSDYQPLTGVLTPMGTKVVSLIQDLLSSTNVGVLEVSHRVKTIESATKKIDGSGGRFETFSDLHDMLGVRVVTYLQSDVDEVVDTLSENFDVDGHRSSDKASMLDPDRFGYLSHHLVVKLNDARATLGEYKPYADMYFEIQVRSILQHAWAQIEHDLGYKSPSGIPVALKRRFARLAGLLETADVEFDALREEATRHAAMVRATVGGGGRAPIDQDSVRALATQDGVVRRADEAICAAIGAVRTDEIWSEFASARADELAVVGFKNTEEIERVMAQDFDALVTFASSWLGKAYAPDLGGDPDEPDEGLTDDYLEDDLPMQSEEFSELSPGISLFYLYLHRQLLSDNARESLADFNDMDDRQFEVFREVHRRAFDVA